MTTPRILAQVSLLALLAATPGLAQDTAAPAADEPAAAEPIPSEEMATEEAAPEPLADEEVTSEEGADVAADAGADAAAEATAEGTGEAAAAPAEPVTRDTVVATVNGTAITLGEVLIAAAQLPPQYQQLPPDILFAGVTDQLVQQELLAQTFTEAPPARVDLALANERRSLLAGEVIQGIMASAVTDEAVQAAYDATYAAAEPAPEWNASHILVATEAEAQAAIDRINGGEDFAAVAQELSTDTGSGAQGGELGWFGPGMMVPEFEQGVAGLEPGALSAPIESQFGWHVIKLNETREQQPPALDEVRAEIEGQVRDEAIQARLAELQAGADVTQPEPGQFDPAVLGDMSLLED